jgi:hypothetical protein
MRKSVRLWASALGLAAWVAALPSPAPAANADQPYQNIDPSNDAGNDTGDSKVEGLNRGQLDENQGAAGQKPSPGASGSVVVVPAPGSPPAPVPVK